MKRGLLVLLFVWACLAARACFTQNDEVWEIWTTPRGDETARLPFLGVILNGASSTQAARWALVDGVQRGLEVHVSQEKQDCKERPSEWLQGGTLNLSLDGRGFHRRWQLDIQVDEGPDRVWVLLALPSNVFVDVFELEHLQRHATWRMVEVTPTDLEVQSDSGLAKPQMLVFCVNINATGGGLLGFPLHLRYPPPTSESSSTVSFILPYVPSVWTPNGREIPVEGLPKLGLTVPRGHLGDAPWVWWTSTVALLLGTLIIWRGLK